MNDDTAMHISCFQCKQKFKDDEQLYTICATKFSQTNQNIIPRETNTERFISFHETCFKLVSGDNFLV